MAVEIRMPQLTSTMAEAKVVKWHRQEGEAIEKDEPLLDVETDKAIVEIDSVASGIMLKILAQEGEIVKVNELLAVIGKPGEDWKPEAPGKPTDNVVEEVLGARAKAKPAQPAAPSAARRPVSPAARRRAEASGIDVNQVTGTGSDGLVTDKDVLRMIEAKGTGTRFRQSPYGDEEVIPLSGIRKAMAEKVDLSRKTAAQATTFAEVDMAATMALRETTQIPVTSYVLKAVAAAVPHFPLVNSSLVDGSIIIKKYINLGVAVSSEHGLTVPVIHNAEQMTVDEMAQKVEELAEKARKGQLSLSDLADGTLSVTNSGIFGSLFFAPIINYPESAIVGMGKVVKTPVVRDDQVVIRPMMYLSLSYDHRVLDGETAVRFLQQVKKGLESPEA